MKDFRFYLGVVLMGCFTAMSGQTPLQDFIDSWVEQNVFSSSSISVSVCDIASLQTEAAYRDRKSAIPASSLKVLTTLITLEQLGPEFRYKTYIAYDGNLGKNGILHGNLYLIGSGDPSLGSGRFEGFPDYKGVLAKVVDAVKAKGIKHIEGKMVVDASNFVSFPVGPTWQWNDLGNYYAGGAWGLNINENEYAIYYNTKGPVGSPAAFVYLDPVVAGLSIDHEVLVDSAGTGDNSYIYGGPYVYKKMVAGSLAQSQQLFKIRGSIPDPPEFMAKALYDTLWAAGIKSAAFSSVTKNSDATRFLLDSILSPPLVQLTQETNYKSINLYCEAFIRALGPLNGGKASSEDGVRFIENYLKEHSFDLQGFSMKDGSGLSARNYVTTDLMADFLAYYAQKHGVEILTHQLPRTGRDGTVKSILANYPMNDSFWMKSGTIDRVVSYTGICKNKAGEWKSFSVIVNNFEIPTREVRSNIEKLFEAIWKLS